jgi:lipopolysaccharide/colanic/teichoic acid biosynthesis glycosyltransferase
MKERISSNLPVPDNSIAKGTPSSTEMKGFYVRRGKRIFDFALSILGLIVLAPLLLIIGGLVGLCSPGPVIFRQRRVGKNGNEFWILKFRSMVHGAERIGRGITTDNDPRVTALGAFLRKWKLDELPQLWNVLRGDMSLVGPRPELPRYVREYSQSMMRVLQVRPGITDAATLRYRNEGSLLQRSSDPERFYCEKILPEKLVLNLQYLDEISFRRDLFLLLVTIGSIANSSEVESE